MATEEQPQNDNKSTRPAEWILTSEPEASCPICTIASCSSPRPTRIPALPFCHSTFSSPRPKSLNYPNALNTLGDHLRKRRLDLGLLQKQVAAEIGVNTLTVCNWESN